MGRVKFYRRGRRRMPPKHRRPMNRWIIQDIPDTSNVNNNNQVQEQTTGSAEIPGFYHNKRNGKYYRLPLPPGFADDQLPESDLRNSSSVLIQRRQLNNVNLLSLIQNRECCGTSLTAFRPLLCRFRLQTSRYSSVNELPDTSRYIECIHLVAGLRNSLCGVWQSHRQYEYKYFDVTIDGIDEFSHWSERTNSCTSVTDIAFKDDFPRHIISTEIFRDSCFFTDPPQSPFSSLSYLIERQLTPEPHSNLPPAPKFRSNMSFSVAFSKASRFTAVGGVGKVHIMHSTSGSNFFLRVNADRIHSLSFCNNGKSLFASSHRGCIYFFDNLKSLSRPSYKINCSRLVICHLQTVEISGNMYVVCSGYNNYLALIDSSSKKTLVQFTGHVNKDMKVRFSVDVQLGVICSSGQDGRTRLWNLFTGKMLLDLDPPKDYKGASHQVHSVLMGPDGGQSDPFLVVVYGPSVHICRPF